MQARVHPKQNPTPWSLAQCQRSYEEQNVEVKRLNELLIKQASINEKQEEINRMQHEEFLEFKNQMINEIQALKSRSDVRCKLFDIYFL